MIVRTTAEKFLSEVRAMRVAADTCATTMQAVCQAWDVGDAGLIAWKRITGRPLNELTTLTEFRAGIDALDALLAQKPETFEYQP